MMISVVSTYRPADQPGKSHVTFKIDDFGASEIHTQILVSVWRGDSLDAEVKAARKLLAKFGQGLAEAADA